MALYREAVKIDMVPPFDGTKAPKLEKFTEYFYDNSVRGACHCNKAAANCKCRQPLIKGEKAAKNFAKPTLTDLRCDIDLIIKHVVPVEQLVQFWEAYVNYDSDDPIDMEIHADKIMGGGRHQLEQRCGGLFRQHGLFPAKNYFTVIRRPVWSTKKS